MCNHMYMEQVKKIEKYKKIAESYKNSENTLLETSKIFNVSIKTIQRALKKFDVVTDKSRGYIILQKSEIEKIHDLYHSQNKTIEEIQEIYNVSRGTLDRFFKKHKLIKKSKKDYKEKFNENFFNKIDTEEKAYFLGLLYADGNVSNKKSVISLGLQERDLNILKLFAEKLNFLGNMYIRKSKSINRQNQWYLKLNSALMKNDLINLGCMPRKSLILKFPTEDQVPLNLIHHFIRGYFDGDGCISASGTPTFTIIGTENFCQKINKILAKELNLNIKKIELHSNKITCRYRVGGNKQIKKIYNYIYKDASIFIKRKHEKFNLILNQ